MNKIDLKEIGKRIQLCRKQRGYTQEKLAEMMDVSIQMISNMERGNKAIRIDNLVSLGRILRVSVDFILTGSENVEEVEEISGKINRLSVKDRATVSALIDFLLE